jgi:hypothetical protein
MSRRDEDRAERIHQGASLHFKLGLDRGKRATAEREARLRGLLGLPPTPAPPAESDQELDE